MSADDSEYGECPNCEAECVAKPGYCWEENIRYWFIECDECEHRTDYWEDASDAVDEWNGGEDDEEEDQSETIATLVRLLSEEREAHEALKTESILAEEEYAVLKKTSGTASNLLDLVRILGMEPEVLRRMTDDTEYKLGRAPKGDELHIANIAPNLTVVSNRYILQKNAQIKKLEEEVVNVHKSYKLEISQFGEQLQAAEKRGLKAAQKVDDCVSALFLLDTALVSLELADANAQHIEPIMSIFEILQGIRRPEWPPRKPTMFDTVLGEIIWIASPYGTRPSPGLYLQALKAKLSKGSDELKEKLRNEVYGKAMSQFGHGSRGSTIAWEALGRPGETPDVRNART